MEILAIFQPTRCNQLIISVFVISHTLVVIDRSTYFILSVMVSTFQHDIHNKNNSIPYSTIATKITISQLIQADARKMPKFKKIFFPKTARKMEFYNIKWIEKSCLKCESCFFFLYLSLILFLNWFFLVFYFILFVYWFLYSLLNLT